MLKKQKIFLKKKSQKRLSTGIDCITLPDFSGRIPRGEI